MEITRKMTPYRLYEPGWESQTQENIDSLIQLEELISKLLREKDIVKIAEESLSTIAHLANLTEMILTIWDEDTKRFRVLACNGYSADLSKKILNLQYSGDWVSLDVPKEIMVLEDVLYLTAEDMWAFKKGDMKDELMLELFEDVEQDFYIDHPEEIDKPRKSNRQWHELDFFEFILRDYNGNPIGYVEINDTKDKKENLPSKDTLLIISLLIKVTGIALQTARMRIQRDEITARMESLSMLMTHDLDRFLRNLFRTLVRIRESQVDESSFEAIIGGLVKSTEKSIWIIEKVRKLKEIESRSYTLTFRTDILHYIRKSAEKIVTKNTNLQINIRTDKKNIYTKCDPLIEELFDACFDTIASLKKNIEEDLVVEISEKESSDRFFKELDIVFTSPDIGLPAWRQLRIEITMLDPRLRRIADTSDIFTKQLIFLLSRKYGGRVWVEETIGSIGAPMGCLHILLPIDE